MNPAMLACSAALPELSCSLMKAGPVMSLYKNEYTSGVPFIFAASPAGVFGPETSKTPVRSALARSRLAGSCWPAVLSVTM